MKSSEILREAARLVALGERRGGCSAIWLASGTLTKVANSSKYFSNFRPEKERRSGYWWDEERFHEPRIIALCLAAAIAEAEGD